MKSIDYFIQSLRVPYVACKCRDWPAYLVGKCNCSAKENRALMGENCDTR